MSQRRMCPVESFVLVLRGHIYDFQSNLNIRQAVLLPGDSLVPPVKGVASTTTPYSQALTVLCFVVVFIAAGAYYSSTLINSFVCKRETNLV
jgi:hypothetical protein